jgi:hypothetical protein
MTDPDLTMDPIRVHVVSADTPAPAVPDRMPRARTWILDDSTPHLILGRSPNRCQASIQVVGKSTDLAWLCISRADAQIRAGALVMGLQVVHTDATGEVWAIADTGGSLALSVLATYRD